jgi:hypothetical protein
MAHVRDELKLTGSVHEPRYNVMHTVKLESVPLAMRELVARPREIAAGLPDAVLPVGSAHSVSLGADDDDAGAGVVLAPSSAGGGVSFTSTARERSATARSITLVSSGCNLDEGEGREIVARPRDISEPDEPAERVLSVRPRDINAHAPAPPPAAAAPTHAVGPLGLALPVWKSEYNAKKEKAEREVNQRAAEGGHVHGYGGGRTYWDAYYSDPSCFAEAYTREWYARMHVCMCACMNVCMRSMHACMHACMNVCMRSMHVCMHECVHA